MVKPATLYIIIFPLFGILISAPVVRGFLIGIGPLYWSHFCFIVGAGFVARLVGVTSAWSLVDGGIIPA